MFPLKFLDCSLVERVGLKSCASCFWPRDIVLDALGLHAPLFKLKICHGVENKSLSLQIICVLHNKTTSIYQSYLFKKIMILHLGSSHRIKKK